MDTPTTYTGTWADAALSTLAYLVDPSDVVSAEPLSPDEPRERHVIMSSSGELIDGADQVARLLRWAELAGADTNAIAIRILIADDEPAEYVGIPGFAARRQTRITRMREHAASKRTESAAAFQAARQISDYIPLGQPILVGHHSEKRHRRDLKRIDQRIARGIEATKEAESLERRVANAEKNRAIFSDDPEAVDKLRAKLASIDAERKTAAAINAVLRKAKQAKGRPWEDVAREGLAALGLKEKTIENALKPDFARRLGVPAYHLSNLSAESRRVKARIDNLTKRASSPPPPTETVSDIQIDEVNNRLRLRFPGKPSDPIRASLRSSGFRWSPTEGVWQRHASNAAWHAARDLAKKASPPPSTPPVRDWKLRIIRDRGPHAKFRYEVQGENLNFPPTDKDYFFTWNVPDIDDPRYDTSNAIRIPGDAPTIQHAKSLVGRLREITEAQLRAEAKSAAAGPAAVAVVDLARLRRHRVPVRIFAANAAAGYVLAA